MQSAAAERIATEIYDAIHDNIATKQDLEARLTHDLAIAVRDLKIWTGSLFVLLVAILSGVIAVFHFVR
jgi:hypothetical protein